jgi:hypothetical protein
VRVSAELDWAVDFFLGRAPLSPVGTRCLTEATKARGRTDRSGLHSRAVRILAGWPGMGEWSEELPWDVRRRIHRLVSLAGDLKATCGDKTAWSSDGEADPDRRIVGGPEGT